MMTKMGSCAFLALYLLFFQTVPSVCNPDNQEGDEGFYRRITMDLKDLDSQKFMIDGEESDKMASGLVVPKLEYRVPKVTYGDFTLWESENGWECTHADVYVSAENIIIVLGLENGSESGYKAQLKLADREWQEIEMFEVNRLLFDIVIMDIDERNLRGRFLRHA